MKPTTTTRGSLEDHQVVVGIGDHESDQVRRVGDGKVKEEREQEQRIERGRANVISEGGSLKSKKPSKRHTLNGPLNREWRFKRQPPTTK